MGMFYGQEKGGKSGGLGRVVLRVFRDGKWVIVKNQSKILKLKINILEMEILLQNVLKLFRIFLMNAK